MKLILDVANDTYKNAMNGIFRMKDWCEAIKKGIACDELREDIQEDIDKLSEWYFYQGMEDYAQVISTDVMNVINKHIGKEQDK